MDNGRPLQAVQRAGETPSMFEGLLARSFEICAAGSRIAPGFLAGRGAGL
jgi:hypothetical protein